jgi:hypothetical protein
MLPEVPAAVGKEAQAGRAAVAVALLASEEPAVDPGCRIAQV